MGGGGGREEEAYGRRRRMGGGGAREEEVGGRRRRMGGGGGREEEAYGRRRAGKRRRERANGRVTCSQRRACSRRSDRRIALYLREDFLKVVGVAQLVLLHSPSHELAPVHHAVAA